ncbi:T6SS phospholipase effector Tle1-like catalytic domain-containing protein [Enterobacter bugandensis]|uniref:T6SS phospholipase effector Tle1-like catalytic domain-containing protein n=1 Tax=Enterobacter bugandensis TaxID=881260 RepID=UPI00200306B7|nr:DUF2235 domain-containing protein [Enterobacter bugandensis]MCK7312047.1 DUF2235 domain-containing protein [Enterobacter bugandensis]HDT4049709.1 DUF2235 domain-containing protein [Enterobacter bugandensis]
MSEVTTDLVWYPPEFPAQGRLPSHSVLVGKNCRQQESLERAYRNELCQAKNKLVDMPCCKTLHISLFFDGTGNNLNNDLYLSDPKHPTNIARLFRATIGNGTVGGVSSTAGLLDSDSGLKGSYYKYYIPGVGTPFPEINDLDYSSSGLAFAKMGEDRINWALLRIIDALKRSLAAKNDDSSKLSDSATRAAIEAMATSWASFGLTGSHNRYETFTDELKKLKPLLGPALQQPSPTQPKLLGIKLYVYGFSRGAAAARAFVNWLSELLPVPTGKGEKPEQCLMVDELKIPVSVEFLGLLDTVASVGVAHVAPVAEGHMSWADNTQELPNEKTYGGLIKNCVHLVSSHEQRLCFPLDSIRRADGQYPANSKEIVYPGMHSDIGGGYPPGDQGKANATHDGNLLSQIALHELYAASFSAGAPLKVPGNTLNSELKKDVWRIFDIEQMNEFAISPELVNRFNAWRELTLNLPSSGKKIADEEAAEYDPPRATVSLEKAFENQIAWITAWRIDRYAKGTMLTTPFYLRASDKDGTPGALETSKAKRDLKQGAVEARRKEKIASQPADKMDELVLEAGIKDFDPDIAQTQLKQAAVEFGEDYRQQLRSPTSIGQLVLAAIPHNSIFLLNIDDRPREYALIKASADTKVATLFPPLGEASNADTPAGLVRALFDDQVHDSRAWFMHYALGTREPWGSYFLYRMIYFGDNCNKSLSPLTIAGDVVGAATVVGGVIFSFRQKGTSAKLAGLAATAGLFTLESQAVDYLTGLAIPMVDNADALKAFTTEPGVVTAQQTAAIGEKRLEMAKSIIQSGWLEKAQSLVTT